MLPFLSDINIQCHLRQLLNCFTLIYLKKKKSAMNLFASLLAYFQLLAHAVFPLAQAISSQYPPPWLKLCPKQQPSLTLLFVTLFSHLTPQILPRHFILKAANFFSSFFSSTQHSVPFNIQSADITMAHNNLILHFQDIFLSF